MKAIDATTARQLTARLDEGRAAICAATAAQMLLDYPELVGSLRMTTPSPAARFSAVAVERLLMLVRAVLVFRQLRLAEKELSWAASILPRAGVQQQHQSAMTRLLFAELRLRDLSPAEAALADEIERFLLATMAALYEQQG